MMLGDMLAVLLDETKAVEALLATGDLVLIAKVEAAAAGSGMPVGELMEELVGGFASRATSDDWIDVMNAAGRTASPGAACLRVMLGFALARQESSHGTSPTAP